MAAKLTKEVLGTIAETKDDLDEILNKQLLEDNASDSMDYALCTKL